MALQRNLPTRLVLLSRVANALLIAGAGLFPVLALYFLEEQTIGLIGIALWLFAVIILFTSTWGKRDIWICYFVIAIYYGWWIAAVFLTDPTTGAVGKRDYLSVWLALRAIAVATGIPLLLFFFVRAGAWLIRGNASWKLKLRDLDWAVLSLVALGSLSAIIGLIHGNKPVLVLGDMYGFLLLPLVYYLAKKTISAESLPLFWKRILVVMIAVALFRVLRFSISYFQGGAFVTGGAVAWLLPIVFFPFMIFYERLGKFRHILLYLISLIVLVLSFARELWLMAALSIPLIFIFVPKNKVLVRAAMVLCVAAPLGLVAINLPIVKSVFPQLEHAITYRLRSALDPSQSIGPGSARRADLEGSLGTMSLQDIPLGMGAGAEYYHPFYKWTEHHIHMTPASIFFRTGLAGLLIFCFFVWISVLKAYKISKAKALAPPQRVIALTALVYFLLAGLDSLLTYGVVNDIFWGFLLGSLAVIHEHLRDKGDQPCAASPVS